MIPSLNGTAVADFIRRNISPARQVASR